MRSKAEAETRGIMLTHRIVHGGPEIETQATCRRPKARDRCEDLAAHISKGLGRERRSKENDRQTRSIARDLKQRTHERRPRKSVSRGEISNNPRVFVNLAAYENSCNSRRFPVSRNFVNSSTFRKAFATQSKESFPFFLNIR